MFKIIHLSIFLCLCFYSAITNAEHNGLFNIDDDWTYDITAKKEFSLFFQDNFKHDCKSLSLYQKQGYIDQTYFTIRDAAIYRDKGCLKHISKILPFINKKKELIITFEFYKYMTGNKGSLKTLISEYDKSKNYRDFIVSLLGFSEDWQFLFNLISGEKDSSGTTDSICESLIWKRFLYGEYEYHTKMLTFLKNKKISKSDYNYYQESCSPVVKNEK